MAGELANALAETAAPVTTALSAAWLRSAGRGEAGSRWHEFLRSLLVGDLGAIQVSMRNILATGETSGKDALAGFLRTMMHWAKSGSSVSD